MNKVFSIFYIVIVGVSVAWIFSAGIFNPFFIPFSISLPLCLGIVYLVFEFLLGFGKSILGLQINYFTAILSGLLICGLLGYEIATIIVPLLGHPTLLDANRPMALYYTIAAILLCLNLALKLIKATPKRLS